MQRSTDRILSTHVGSLARPRPLLETMREKAHGRPYDHELFERQAAEAVHASVAKQAEVGLDVVNDGEQSKDSFFTYIVERLDGFSDSEGEPVLPPSWQMEIDAYPGWYERYLTKYTETVVPLKAMACTGPISYAGHDILARDISNLQAAVAENDVVEAFMPSTSPRGFGFNQHYADDDEYLVAVAEALRVEYLTIVEAGLVLQIDDPWLIEILTGDGTTSVEERQREADRHVEIVNHSLRDIPTDRIRLHTCYGLNHGPRTHDLGFGEIIPHMLRIRAGAYSFEVANPRHMHEWKLWADIDLPDEAVLIPGLIGHATNYVEHPELIADFIGLYADQVGRERVIAGADCGFSSRASFQPEVDEQVAWKKLEALAEGARIATDRLF